MNMPLMPPRLTGDEFETMPDNQGYELIDGRLVEKGMGIESSEIQSELHFLFRLWARQTGLGKFFDSEFIYRCFPDPDRCRKPDASYIRNERLPPNRHLLGSFTIVPDFVVEVVSLHDTVADMSRRIEDYQSVNVPLLWIIHPQQRFVQVRTADGGIREFRADEELTGDPVLPGFRVRVADLFPPVDS